MLPPPYRSAQALETFLTEVFLAAADPGPAVRRAALKFVLSGPDACVHVDGRAGDPARIRTGETARAQSADLTFSLSGETAHAFWSGQLGPVAAMTAGQLRLEGPLLLALALAPGLKRIQAVYRERLDGAGNGAG